MVSAVIFDLDGTLTMTASPWRHVHERLGVWDNLACAYHDEWLAGGISYDEFCRRDAGLWTGHTLAEIESLLDEIDFNRHVPDLIGRLVRDGIPSIIISSGFHYVANKIRVRWAWDPLQIYANELVEGPEIKINVSGDFSSPLSKRSLAEAALRQVNATFDETLVVTDTTRDLEALADCRFKLLINNEDDLAMVHGFLD